MKSHRFFPFADLKDLRRADLGRNVASALGVACLAIPQGVAYAVIAGIPPVMGLYAATLPTFIGSLLRSSRHVVTGPTNAVSLLVGTALALHVGMEPAQVAITLAFMVAIFQLAAGFLKLGMLVDFISHPVVEGYIAGAGVLIGVGQLSNITATSSTSGHLFARIGQWAGDLGAADPLSVGMALGTACVILVLRKSLPRLPGTLMALGLASGLSVILGLHEMGLRTIADLSPIQAGLPGFTLPAFGLIADLLPVAVAVTLLSLVESSSVARSIAARSGQRLDLSAEFTGEGFANLCAAFMGGYPTTGSLSRSALNEREGATSRLSGMLSGVFVLLGIFLLADVINHTPVAALAGLLLVVAAGLIDVQHIRSILRSHNADRFAFFSTLLGTFVLHLDQAIYLGVGISLVLFLRRARLLDIRDLAWDSDGGLREASIRTRLLGARGFEQENSRYCSDIHVLNIAGSMFFGCVGELQAALDDLTANPHVRVVVLRIKRVRDVDTTALEVIKATARHLQDEGRSLLLVGMPPKLYEYLIKTGTAEVLGAASLFPSEPGRWFGALEDALGHAIELTGKPEVEGCPMRAWLASRHTG